MTEYLPCLSVRQPYAWLIVNNIKPVESRTWPDWRTAPAGQAIEHVRGPHEGQVPA